ncbi:MAG: hypothetical protein PHW02_00415 [bacterium]|nr:hypothetical protein [bacterium]
MQRILHLFSGGLDSILSYKLLENAGYEVEAVYFETPFFPSSQAIDYGIKNSIKVRKVNIFKEYIEMLKRPKYGYGKNLNPCIDCKALMINTACRLALKENFSLVSTGEVLGQRPMSQTLAGFQKQKKLLEHPEMVVRVLSREKNENLLKNIERFEISGRERILQMKLSVKLEISHYSTPSGGCFLTYKEFSAKARSLLNKNFTEEKYFYMIKNGRFREYSNGVAIIGRSENDNDNLLKTRTDEKTLQIVGGKGPVALILGVLSKEEEEDLKEVLLKYSKRDVNEKDSIRSI